MILYIHGFSGSGLGANVESIRDYFGDKVLALLYPMFPIWPSAPFPGVIIQRLLPFA